MKKMILLLVSIASTFAQATSPVSCPQFQHDNGAGACEFNSYYDAPAFLSVQNAAVAASLNANPTAPAFSFAKQYGSLPINQQMAIMNCQVGVFNAQYFNIALSVSCPASSGQLDVAAIISSNPAQTNPGNQPSVVYNTSTNLFLPATPIQPGPAVPVNVAPPVTSGNVVGPFNGTVYTAGPAAKTSGLTDGQTYTQGGQVYVFHGGIGLMGFGGYFTAAK